MIRTTGGRLACGSAVVLLGLMVLQSSADFRLGRTQSVVTASEHGCYAVKLFGLENREEHPSYPCALTLFSLKPDGTETLHWTKKLPYVPGPLLVSDKGWVVSLDEDTSDGYEHCLVLWNKQGMKLAAFSLEDLLTPKEIKDHVFHTITNRWWRVRTRFYFIHSPDPVLHIPVHPLWFDLLVIRFEWGQTVVIDLHSGAICEGFEAPEERDGEGPCMRIATWGDRVREYRATKVITVRDPSLTAPMGSRDNGSSTTAEGGGRTREQ